jgi:hypothetical protein
MRYKNLEGLLRGQHRTFMAWLLKKALAVHGPPLLPCAIVRWEDANVVFLYSLDYREGAAKPLQVRQYSWPQGRRDADRQGHTQVIDRHGAVILEKRGMISATPQADNWIPIARAPKRR